MWDAIGQRLRWDKVRKYRSLQQEIERAVSLIPKKELASSVDSWSRRMIQVLKNKGAYIE